jgi:hypothetical protein
LAQEERPLSKVVPVLVAALACDGAIADPATGKKTLVGIFDRVNVQAFPTQLRMAIYLKLTDAEGPYKIDVRYVQTNSGRELGRAEGRMEFASRLGSFDLSIPFPPIEIPSEGRYEFQVWANDVYLGGTFIDAVPMAQQ